MFQPIAAFSGFSVDNLEKAKTFYTDVLGLEVEEQKGMGLHIHLPNDMKAFIYEKKDHAPATFTILNFVVENINDAVDALTQKGVVFEKYEGFGQDDKGIARGLSHNMGPDIAWLKDPAGNILSILQNK